MFTSPIFQSRLPSPCRPTDNTLRERSTRIPQSFVLSFHATRNHAHAYIILLPVTLSSLPYYFDTLDRLGVTIIPLLGYLYERDCIVLLGWGEERSFLMKDHATIVGSSFF